MYCFSKARRLLHKKEFERVFNKAGKIVTDDFVILFCENTEVTARIGFALAKKIVPKASQRNRLKRLVRESFRCNNLPPVDMVILARRGVGEVENKVITTRLSSAWKKIAKYYAT